MDALRFTVLILLIPVTASGIPELRNVDFSAATRQLTLQYTIQRNGFSALRPLAPSDFLLFGKKKTKSKIAQAIWLFIVGHGDAAHEVLLGVNESNQDLAEYSATHPGQTSWHQDHPLDDVDDLLHSLIHRCEGASIGEGGHSGFENAKYWAAGGPKEFSCFGDDTDKYTAPEVNLIHKALLKWSFLHTPKIAALLVMKNETRAHSIIASGRERREVFVRPGCWDPFALIDLCCRSEQQLLNPTEQEELNHLQEFELRLLMKYALLLEDRLACDVDSLLAE